MAGSRIKGITIEIDGSTSKLTDKLKDVNKTLSSTQTELRDVNKLLKLDPSNTTLLQQKQALLQTAISSTKEKLEEEKRALEQLKSAGNTQETQAQQRALEREIADTAQSLNKLESEIEQTDRALNGVGDESKDTAQDFDKLGNEAKEADRKMGGIDGEKVKKILHGVGTAAKASAVALAAIGAAAVAVGKKIYDSAKETAEYGDEVDKMSQKLGLSAEAYQKWDYVMQRADVDINNMGSGIKKLTSQIDAAKNGNAGALESFEKLGISLEDLQTKSREDLFAAAIKGFQGMADSTDRAALANEIFGRSAGELAPLFNQSAEATEELMQKAEDYGMIMSDEAVKASAEFSDSLTTLSMTAQGLKNRLMGELLPGITQITDGLALMFTRDGVEEGIEKFSEGIETTMQSLSEMLSKVMEIGAPILLTLAQSLVDNMPTLMNEGIIPMIQTLGSGLLEMLPELILILQGLLVSLATELPGIIQSILESGVLETLLGAGLEILLALIQGITDAISNGELIGTAVTVITSLVNGLIENLPAIIQAATDLIIALALALTEPDTLTNLVVASLDLIMALVDGLIAAIPQLIAAAPELINNLVTAFVELLPKIVMSGNQISVKLGEGIMSAIASVVSAVAQIKSNIENKIKEVVDKIKSWGKDLIGNFVGGIKEKWDSAKSTIEGIADFISGLFHHSTPDFGPLKDDDKWFADMMDNFIDGMEKKMPALRNAVKDVAGIVSEGIPGIMLAGSPVAAAGITNTTNRNSNFTVNQYNTYASPHSDYELWQSQQALTRSVETISRGAI